MKKFFAKLFGKKAKPVAKPADVKPAAPAAAPAQPVKKQFEPHESVLV